MRTVDINLQSNLVTIAPAADRELDLAAVPRAIRDAGFRPGEFTIHAVGTVEPGAPDCFRIRGWSRCYPTKGKTALGEAEIDARVETSGETVALEMTPIAR